MTKSLLHLIPQIVCIALWMASAQAESEQEEVMHLYGAPSAGDTRRDNQQQPGAEIETMPTDEFGQPLSYCQLPWDYIPKSDKPAPPAKLQLLPRRAPQEP